MNLELSGQTVTRICFEYAVSLLLDAGVEIRIGTAFSLRTAGGRVLGIESEHVRADAEHILSVLHEHTADAVAQDSGTLVLDFVNGARIEVAANETYEAWTLAGPHGRKVVVTPGGALVTWDPAG